MELAHVELSVVAGTLDPAYEADLDRLLHGVFGWSGTTSVDDVPDEGLTKARTYTVTPHVNLVLREQVIGFRPGMEDHLGFRVSGDELDHLVERTIALATEDERVELRHVEQGRVRAVDMGPFVFKTFFVRFLLPMWFQFESYDRRDTDTSA